MKRLVLALVPCALFLWSCDLQPKIVHAFDPSPAGAAAASASADWSADLQPKIMRAFDDAQAVTPSAATVTPPVMIPEPAPTPPVDSMALYGNNTSAQYGTMDSGSLYGTTPNAVAVPVVMPAAIVTPVPAVVSQPATPAPVPAVQPASVYGGLGILDDHSPDDVLLVPVRVANADQRVTVVPPENGEVVVQSGDTLFAISQRYDVPLRDLISENALAAPYAIQAGQKLKLPDARYHVVAAGDTLYSISRAHNVDLNSLAQTNGMTTPYNLIVGQKLRLPATIEPSPAAAVPVRVETTQPALPPVTTVSIIKPSPKDIADSASTPKPVVPSGQMYGNVPAVPAVTQPAVPQTASAGAPPVALAQGGPSSNAARHPAPNITDTPRGAAGNVVQLPRATGRTSTKFSWPVSGKIVSDFGAKKNGLYNDGINIAAAAGTPVRAAENGVVAYAGNELKGMGNLVIIQHTGGWMTVYAHMDTMNVKRGDKVSVGAQIGAVGQTGKVDSPQLHFEIRNGTKAYNPRTQMK